MTVLHLPSDTIGAQAARTTLAAVPAVHAQSRCGDDVHEACGDDGGGDDDDGDDVAQMIGARKQVFHVCHALAAVLVAQLDYAAEMPDVN